MKLLPIGVLLTIAAALAATMDVPMMQPKDLAAQLNANASKPMVIQVGPSVMFRSKHIAGSSFAGPGSSAAGLDLLKAAVANVPKDREIALYCGCCPWDRCPNINPAIALLKDLGYTKVKAVYIKENFKTDWSDPGYPVE
jgi:thiosulfate/3-mercaptopyruvate sulfurtransferase